MGPEGHSTLYICFVIGSRLMKRGFCIICIAPECFWPLALKIPYLSSYWEQCNPVAKLRMIEIIHMDLIVAPALSCLPT